MAILYGMWDLRSLTRDQTCAPFHGRVLTTGPAGNSLKLLLNAKKA